MTYAEIRAEVRGLRFNSSQDPSINRWINDRYAALWGMEEWTFRYEKVNNAFLNAANANVQGLPSDFGIALGLWREEDGQPIRYMEPRHFEDISQGSTSTGAPQFYTIYGGGDGAQPQVYPIPDVDYTLTLDYEKRCTPLAADGDEPAIPEECHYALVYGALSVGLALVNDFTYQFMQGLWQESIQEMRANWLNPQRGDLGQWGRDSVEALPTYWGV